jgi:hypothetical protein
MLRHREQHSRALTRRMSSMERTQGVTVTEPSASMNTCLTSRPRVLCCWIEVSITRGLRGWSVSARLERSNAFDFSPVPPLPGARGFSYPSITHPRRRERHGNTLHGFCTHDCAVSRFVLPFRAANKRGRNQAGQRKLLGLWDESGGRGWDRTSDPRRVKTVLSR